ncbi:UNVERIFIED_CONTAM: DExH-box ATP-dependent RNA helicase DExH10 [Sesamum calycinum]|uniref:DExH-box ATP-dependent RNA helicase DExH10 n=1 Tax=Sesamum calycinum TaxID=2727403 RepID=A0AAW2N431_9LAMI
MGGSGLYLVVDENEQFKEDNFLKLQDTFTKQNLAQGNKSGNAKASGRIAKGGVASGGSDIYKIVKMIMERKFQPVIIFSFSRRECEQHAMSMSKLDFNTEEEKDVVEQVFKNAILCLNDEDRHLPAIELMLPLLQRGIAVHHSGLLPIIKELVELLFQEGLVKALFATETFAMGLNMPAKTVVFTSVKKWDGDSHRYIGSGEYIQMSGRAGRRGENFNPRDDNSLLEMFIQKELHLIFVRPFDFVLVLLRKLWLCLMKLLKVKVREGGTDWGWGVVVNVVKLPSAASGSLPAALCLFTLAVILWTPASLSLAQVKMVLDQNHVPLIQEKREKCMCPNSDKGDTIEKFPFLDSTSQVPVQLPLISGLSKLRLSIPADLRPTEARKDMGIEDPEFVELANKIEELEHKLVSHPLHKSQDDHQIRSFQRKAEVNHEIQQLKSKMRDSQLQKFRDELKNRSRVLRRLGHIDGDGVVQLKGRAACLIDTGDELLVTELMFNGTFNDLDHHQVAALASCFIPGDRSTEQIQLRAELAKPLQQLRESAKRIAEIQRECKLEVNVDEYVEASIRPYLMDVIYCWSKISAAYAPLSLKPAIVQSTLIGSSFAEVIQMTDIFEGSIIRLARRLDEFLNQLKAAAHAVGEVDLENKFAAASESLRRGIMFANSLYL